MATATEKPTRQPKGSGLVLAGVPRVNLLPASEIERRGVATLTRRWIAGLAVTAVMVSGLVGAAQMVRATAAARLSTEQDRTLALNNELAGYSHVSVVIGQRTALTTLRDAAMGNDVEWRALFRDLTSAIPGSAELTGFDLMPGTNPIPEPVSGTAVGVVGRLTIASKQPADQVRTIDRLRGLETVLSADAGAVTQEEDGSFVLIIEVVVDQAHYSGEYVAPGGVR